MLRQKFPRHFGWDCETPRVGLRVSWVATAKNQAEMTTADEEANTLLRRGRRTDVVSLVCFIGLFRQRRQAK